MPGNHIEQLVAEWYEYQGYFVRRNIKVDKLQGGGYACELDVVALHPGQQKLVHIETSLDGDSWKVREERFRRKFDAGERHIRDLFDGMDIPDQIDRIAVFICGSSATHPEVGGGKVMMVVDVLREIADWMQTKTIGADAVPEQYPILRTIQFLVQYRGRVGLV